MPSHAQDLETQDRLTKNIKDLLWLNTYAGGKDIKPSDALAALEVVIVLLRSAYITPHPPSPTQITPLPLIVTAPNCSLLGFASPSAKLSTVPGRHKSTGPLLDCRH